MNEIYILMTSDTKISTYANLEKLVEENKFDRNLLDATVVEKIDGNEVLYYDEQRVILKSLLK